MAVSNEQYVLDSLSQSSFLLVNKSLLRELQDSNACIILSNFVSMYRYLKETNRLLPDGWFFQTGEQLEQDLGLSSFKQTRAISVLEEKGFIEVRNFGRPCKRHFKIDIEKIASSLSLISSKEKPLTKKKEDKEAFYKALNEKLKEDKYVKGMTVSNLKPESFLCLYVITKLIDKSNWAWVPKEVGFVLEEMKKDQHAFDPYRMLQAYRRLISNRLIAINNSFFSNLFKEYRSIPEASPDQISASIIRLEQGNFFSFFNY